MTSCESCPKQTAHHSWQAGELAKGCQLCVKGEKLVLFVTGRCAQRCFYCPVSGHKFGKVDAYANEWKIEDTNNPVELIKEAKLTRATGAGVTGGDPLADLDRTRKYIALLKKEFGPSFHIHLYTPLKLVTEEALQRLADAGLDEIRFHPDLDDDTLWPRLNLAQKFGWEIGVEIPAVPGYEEKTKKLIDFIVDKATFLNLNELELSDTDAEHYKLGGMFEPKDDISHGVLGSEKIAIELACYAREKGLNVHCCTAKLKDRVQVGNRIIRRANTVALPTDEITDEGMLIRGCAYFDQAVPGMDYQKRMGAIDRKAAIEFLENARLRLLPEIAKRVQIDAVKLRLLTSKKLLRKNAIILKKLGLVPAIVEEYPTADALEIEVDFL